MREWMCSHALVFTEAVDSRCGMFVFMVLL